MRPPDHLVRTGVHSSGAGESPPDRPAHGSVLLEAVGIVKKYPGVHALKGVSFELRAGEVHALLGENGAGKSTLVKIITGSERADEGEIRLRGERVEISSPRKAHDLGIGVIYQEVGQELIGSLSVAENIFLGREPVSRCVRRIRWRESRRRAYALLEQLSVDPTLAVRAVDELGVGERQSIAIAKALSADTSIVVMDEPTAALNEHERTALFRTVRRLKESGVGIVYISHRLDELREIADRVTVLRDGSLVGTTAASDDPSELIRMMVGHEIAEQYPREDIPPGEAVLAVDSLSGEGFSGVSLTVAAGQTVGIFGSTGCGSRELVRALYGLVPVAAGEVSLGGRKLALTSPRSAIAAGIALISDDRKLEGLLLSRSVRENVSAPTLAQLTSFGRIRRHEEARLAREQIESLDVRTPSIEQTTRYLSGGNQQKVVLAKWLRTSPRVFLLHEPTRGVDVGAKAEMYRLVNRMKREGAAVLLVSSELTEVLGIADHVLVMRGGRVVGEFDPTAPATTQAAVLHASSGAGDDRAA